MADLDGWNYVIGFGAFFLGLMVSAHPSTPLGRGRGVVVGMLGCFLIGLIWICTYYVISDDVSRLPIFNDLGQLQPGRRHRLHGRRLHLRHPVGMSGERSASSRKAVVEEAVQQPCRELQPSGTSSTVSPMGINLWSYSV